MMGFHDRPQLPLTNRRKALVAIGGLLFAAQLIAAAVLAEPTTGEGDANVGVLAMLWAGSVVVSTVATLLVIRQADIADVFTAALLVTIAPFAVYALVAALAVRGTDEETDVVDAMFLGITAGALTAILVWAIAMGAARLLKLPTSDGLEDDERRDV
jgi:hypothetical protein